jgi:arylsulfatase A-like enzyme
MPLCRLFSLCLTLGVGALFLVPSPARAENKPERPNVILVMTDDQGYGDLSCHGNPELSTPHLDRLYGQSVRLTDFHVDPTCSPTRSALMTGRYSSRTGVWHTIMGRSLLRRDEVTLADWFAASGYQTGIFGKWHLGDNYPFRPQDRGFAEVFIHGGGGVGQTPDYWGNDYFDDTYFHNGKPVKVDGYCTDVWFDACLKFIDKNKDRPFFAYLPTNAAHGPYLVADKYSKPFRNRGLPAQQAAFFGMIVNIDENMGRLMNKLEESKLAENTLLIFMTDNGTAAGRFNAGMRGKKGSEYEGGHRVPCFLRWPGKIDGGRDVPQLTAHIDLLPTLVDLCHLEKPGHAKPVDGKSLVPLLRRRRHEGGTRFREKVDWPERTLFVHSQRIEHPQKWRKCAVMTERWRLVNGKELYDLRADPGQKKDVAGKHPQVVAELGKAYDDWYASISRRFDEYCPSVLGAREANPTLLTCHDWHGKNVPWNQGMIRRDPQANGFWAVDVARPGTYRFTLRQRPKVARFPIQGTKAWLKIGKVEESKPIPAGATAVTFQVHLDAGESKLQTRFSDKGASRGAFFVEVEYLGTK